jgi:hypothetical protein
LFQFQAFQEDDIVLKKLSGGRGLQGAWRLVAAGIFLTCAIDAHAQTTLGSIAGSVRDPQGARLPGATVEVTSERRADTQRTTTNAEGDFVILNLPPDTYRLKVTIDGFKTLDRENVVLSANDRMSVGIVTLELGALAETVTVAGRVVEVQVRSAERSFSIDSTAIENLAVNGRDPLLLAKLAPGIANASAGTGINVNGAAATQPM